MRIVHITQSSPIQMYFANILNQTHPLYAIFIENVWANNWRRYKKKVRKNIEKHGLHTLPKQLIEGTYLYYQNKMVHKTERDFFSQIRTKFILLINALSIKSDQLMRRMP